jgi:hypothetical protein
VYWSRTEVPAIRIVHDQAGLLLIEEVVAIGLLAVVLSAVLLSLEVAGRTAPRDVERGHALHETQVGLDSMARELRQASAINATTPNLMDVNVTRDGQTVRVRYDCHSPHCVREQLAADGSVSSERVLIEPLLNGTATDPVFSFTPPDTLPPSYVEARVEVPARGSGQDGYEHPIVLDDGFELRNVSLSR